LSRNDHPGKSSGRPLSLTMADLAKMAGTSKITISRALANSPLVSTATRQRIQALARKHGYKLNISARNLRLRRSLTVAVIVEMKPSIDRSMMDPYPLRLLGSITQELSIAGYSVLLTTRPDMNSVAVQAADGLILLGQGVHQHAVQQFDKLGLPMAVWGASPKGDRHIVVGSDNCQGGAIVAEHFISIGRRHPVFIGNPGHPEIRARMNGFVDMLTAHNIKPMLIRRSEFTMAAGMNAVHSLTTRKTVFDSIFASSDLLAMGAIRALDQLGLATPQDVSVIGYDDTPLGANFMPPLSSVHQDWQEGGTLLARKVLALINGETPNSEMLPAVLVVRET